MKKIGYREIRHIVANHMIKNQSTAYCMKSKSIAFKLIRKLIKYNWIECKNVDGPFLFVRSSEKLITIFGTTENRFEMSDIQELQKNLIYDSPAQNSQFKSFEISVA